MNKDSSKCPITFCSMRDKHCDEPFINGIYIDDKFKISAVSNSIDGWKNNVCIVCENID